MKDLSIDLPKECKKPLSKRFRFGNFVYAPFCRDYFNHTPCILCDKYEDKDNGCMKCPFYKFETLLSRGCMYWMRKIAGDEFMQKMEISKGGIGFDKWNEDFIESALKKLKAGAKKHIKWV